MAILPVITFTILLLLFTKQTLTEKPTAKRTLSREELLAKIVAELVVDDKTPENRLNP